MLRKTTLPTKTKCRDLFPSKYHFIRGCLEDGSVKTNYISTQDQLADFLTKSLGRVKFQELRSRIGMIKIP
jgi:hypothetical protein